MEFKNKCITKSIAKRVNTVKSSCKRNILQNLLSYPSIVVFVSYVRTYIHAYACRYVYVICIYDLSKTELLLYKSIALIVKVTLPYGVGL